jgi:hypothetical protein
MPMFRKKPIVVEAMHFDSETAGNAIVRWTGGEATGLFDDGSGPYLIVKTLNGPVRVTLGEWVIRGVAHEHYPCAGDVFGATYEPVEVRSTDVDDAHAEQVAAAAIAYGRASTPENRAALMALLETASDDTP